MKRLYCILGNEDVVFDEEIHCKAFLRKYYGHGYTDEELDYLADMAIWTPKFDMNQSIWGIDYIEDIYFLNKEAAISFLIENNFKNEIWFQTYNTFVRECA